MGSGRRGPGWTRVAVEDVVRLNTERASDPEAAGFSCYVGLEHIDPDDLTIRRWGNTCGSLAISECARLLRSAPLARLADVADVRYGLSITRLAAAEKIRRLGVPCLRVANVMRNSMDLADVKTVNELDGDDKYRLL